MDASQTFNQGIAMAQHLKELLVEYTVKYGFQVLAGLIILFVGYKIAEWVSKTVFGLCQKKHLDITLSKFIASVVKWIVFAFAILMAVEKFGITISPLIASISALIFGASFAIQAPLSNYAAGLSVILSRPFVVGNTITIQGVHGQVEEVKLAATILATGDGEKISIPNKEIVGQILVNSFENKVVNGKIGISYNDDPGHAVRTIGAVLKGVEGVVQTPAPQIGISAFGDSSINIDYRYWAPTADYMTVVHRVNAAVYKAIQDAGITIPYPRQDVFQIPAGKN
jgi:small conductance mechanosensitive channel